MKTKTYAAILCVILLLTAGGEKAKTTASQEERPNEEVKMKGDSTVYGLACEGCNDSTIVLLPFDGRDPVSYEIIDANRNGRVLGDIQIGDWIGVVVSKQDKRVADEVIDLDELKGIWCKPILFHANMVSGCVVNGRHKVWVMSANSRLWSRKAL